MYIYIYIYTHHQVTYFQIRPTLVDAVRLILFKPKNWIL